MHAVSSLYGAQDFLRPVEPMKNEISREDCSFKDYPCDKDMFHFCRDLEKSDDVFIITDLYLRLRQLINDELRE